MAAGIYAITHEATGRRYVGSAVNVSKRWSKHKCALSRGSHHSPKLQNGWNKYGPDAFTFAVVELVADVADLIAREQAWMDRGAFPAYNTAPVAGSPLGVKHGPQSQAIREATAARMTGNTNGAGNKGTKRGPQSPEHTAAIAAGNAGQKRTPEQCANISLAQTGKKKTPEHCANMSAARKGRPQSPEHIAARMAGKAAARARRDQA